MLDPTLHDSFGARWTEVNGVPIPMSYGDPVAEYRALRETVAVIDLSSRGRLCLVGSDRAKFLHGQLTNDILQLKEGQGCYAAIVNAKAKMESDAFVWALRDELLLDLEPGLSEHVSNRLEKFIIAADVQIVDAAPSYSLLALQGPRVQDAIDSLELGSPCPAEDLRLIKIEHPVLGELYLARLDRFGCPSFDLFVPTDLFPILLRKAITVSQHLGGRLVGWQAWETVRIEAGIPRFGLDMDASNLPPEAGLQSRAISTTKGCYTGQEVLARIRTYGQVAKALRGLRFDDPTTPVPEQGAKLYLGEREVGFVTSSLLSPKLGSPIALGYVRREANKLGTRLVLRNGSNDSSVVVTALDGLLTHPLDGL